MVPQESSWAGLADLQTTLRCFLLRRCPDPNELEDVVQETLLRAARYRSNLQENDRLKSWTMRIATNVLADRRRRGWRYFSAGDEDGVDDDLSKETPDDPPFRIGRFDVDRSDAVQLMTRVMEAMRDDDRTVLASFYGGDESCRSTASECDIPAHLVKVRLFRARKRLCSAMRHRLALDNSRPRRADASRHRTLQVEVAP